jgi:hypothetical protein
VALRSRYSAIGYYTFDEPKIEELPTVFDQYKVLRRTNSGSSPRGVDQCQSDFPLARCLGRDWLRSVSGGIPINADEYRLRLKLVRPSLINLPCFVFLVDGGDGAASLPEPSGLDGSQLFINDKNTPTNKKYWPTFHHRGANGILCGAS